MSNQKLVTIIERNKQVWIRPSIEQIQAMELRVIQAFEKVERAHPENKCNPSLTVHGRDVPAFMLVLHDYGLSLLYSQIKNNHPHYGDSTEYGFAAVR
jgi:hypothetical protein